MPHGFVCTVPHGECNGKSVQVVPISANRQAKIHDSYDSVKRCIRNYMSRKGYTPGPNGEFKKDGYPTEVIGGHPGVRVYYTKEKTRFVFHRQRIPVIGS